MKKLLILLALALAPVLAEAQTKKVEMKNGDVITGQVIEEVPGEYLRVRTADGSVITCQYAEIAKITLQSEPIKDGLGKSELDLDDYGSAPVSYGIRLSVPGVIGAGIRYAPSGNVVLDASAFYGGVPAPTFFEENNIENGFALMGSATFFGKKAEKTHKNKVIRHGFSAKVGNQFGDFATTIVSGSWAKEIFRKGRTGRSFTFELGLGAYLPRYSAFFDYSEPETKPTLQIGCHWNWFSKN